MARRVARDRKGIWDQLNIDQMPPQQRGLPAEVTPLPFTIPATMCVPHPILRTARLSRPGPSNGPGRLQGALLSKWRRLWQHEANNQQRLPTAQLQARMLFTFKQMLMVCWLLPQAWHDAASWMATQGHHDSARALYTRAIEVLPKSDLLQLAFARFEERSDNLPVRHHDPSESAPCVAARSRDGKVRKRTERDRSV